MWVLLFLVIIKSLLVFLLILCIIFKCNKLFVFDKLFLKWYISVLIKVLLRWLGVGWIINLLGLFKINKYLFLYLILSGILIVLILFFFLSNFKIVIIMFLCIM